MKKPSKAEIARACLIAWFVLFVMSAFLLCGPGCYVEWYAVTAFALLPAIVMGTWRQRILVCLCLAVTLLLILDDHAAGMGWRRMRRRAELNARQRDVEAEPQQPREGGDDT